MKLLSRETLAESAHDRWKLQYPNERIGTRLRLERTSDPGEVDRITGNTSWTDTKCQECGNQGIPVIQLGEEPDYESATTEVCKECLLKALELIPETKEQK